MLGALIYLRLTSFRNWVLWRLRRLRQPKYLVGAIVGVAYFYFFFFRRVGGRGSRHAFQAANASAAALPTDWLPIALAVGALVLLVFLAFAWIVPTQRAALGFTEAEIAFLFPAPVTRGALVHFRLLSGQLRSLGAGLLMSLVSNRWTLTGGTALTLALGWWLIFSTLNLHYTGASFTLTRMADRGVNVWTRRGLALAGLVAVFAVAIWRLPAEARLPAASVSGMAALGEWILAVSLTAPLSWLLYPLRLVLGPFFAGELHHFALALGPALGVIALHYLWVVRSVTTFEDASILQAERRAARMAAWKSGERRIGRAPVRGRGAPFRLAGTGRPEIAFLWKNLLSTSPYFNLRVLGVAAAIIVVASAYAKTRAPVATFAAGAAWVCVLLAGYLLVLGPQFARQDVRSDMRNIDVLKTYPLAGWQVVLGEILAPTAILTGFVWLALLIVVLNAEARGALTWLTPGFRVAAGASAALMVPPIVTLQLLVPNAAALIFPGWFEASRTRGGGPEVMGQRMIFLFAQLLMIVLMLLPAALMGAVVAWLAQFVAPIPVAVAIAVLPVTVILVAEVAGGLWWLGRRFEQIDVAEELRA